MTRTMVGTKRVMGIPRRKYKVVEKDAKHFKKDNRHIGTMYSSTSTQTKIVNVITN
jgi:ribosomal protein L34E